MSVVKCIGKLSPVVRRAEIKFQHTVAKTFSAQAGVSSDYVTIHDKKLHFVRRGDGEHPLLFMPGALGTALSDFGPQIEGFSASDFTIIGWDPPGYGKSRPPARDFKNFFQEDARMAVEMMKTLGFQKFSLLGWSDGGITALVAAARSPENMRKLVVWGANAYIAKSDIDMIEKVSDVSQWSDRMRKPMEDIYGSSFPSLWSSWCEAYKDYYDKGGDICKDDLAKITAPSLVIHGMKDAMVAEEHIHFLHQNINNSKQVIWEEGKHNLHLKYRNEFNKMVQEFLLEK